MASQQTIVQKGTSNGGQSDYNFTINSTGKVYYWNNSGTSTVIGGTSVNNGKWNHVADTLSGTTATVYVNGASDGSATVQASYASTCDVLIGTCDDSTTGNCAESILQYFNGSIDEVKIDSVARTAEEIAEAYRAGRDHYINKTISSTDLSGKSSLPFYLAADRPGYYLSATIGESAFANYQSDANTVGLWHLEENYTSKITCYSLKLDGATSSGNYLIDPDGNGGNAPFLECQFTITINSMITLQFQLDKVKMKG